MTSARFRDLGNGITGELMADQVQLFYDPTTQQARVIFNGNEYIDVGVQNYLAIGTMHDALEVDLSDKMANCYGGGTDPVTGIDLSQVSVAGLMIILKVAYDVFVNERAAAQVPTPTPSPSVGTSPTATPAPTPTPTPDITVTPTISPTPSVTPTVSLTPSPSVTPSVT